MISQQVTTRARLLCAWSGAAYVVLVFIAVWPMAKMFPPPAPSLSMNEIYTFVQENRNGIRLGMVVQMLAAAAAIPFTGVVAHYTAQAEGHVGALTVSVTLGGMALCLLTFYPAMWLLLHLYRVELSPELVYHGVGGFWLQFVGGITTFYPVLIVMAICAFGDQRKRPLYPRWFGYFCLWNLLMFVPGLVAFFLYSGPFAWNGLLALWVPLFVLVVWFGLVIHYLRIAILRDAEQEAVGNTPAANPMSGST